MKLKPLAPIALSAAFLAAISAPIYAESKISTNYAAESLADEVDFSAFSKEITEKIPKFQELPAVPEVAGRPVQDESPVLPNLSEQGYVWTTQRLPEGCDAKKAKKAQDLNQKIRHESLGKVRVRFYVNACDEFAPTYSWLAATIS